MLLLGGLDAVLTGATLFDAYQDATAQDKPLWTTLAEKIYPLLPAVAIPITGWQLSRSARGPLYTTQAGIWNLGGAGVTLIVAGMVPKAQVVQEDLKPGALTPQYTMMGVVAGFFGRDCVAPSEDKLAGKFAKQEWTTAPQPPDLSPSGRSPYMAATTCNMSSAVMTPRISPFRVTNTR